ncbi:mcfX [Symbiodinium natans]|uniref:McfX protein n=1 Tax=Symbiodinium natans TaxID=878477 RepID=A0A812PZE8_9DINO|nr:mcfX [Symbiodinium natans]
MSVAARGDFAGQGTVQEELLWAAAGGIVYGATATLLGQPLDTIKTKMQTEGFGGAAGERPGILQVARQILRGAPQKAAIGKLAGFYRGSLPVLVGSVAFRSVPFTVYSGVYASLHAAPFCSPFLGVEGRIWASGVAAGLGRAVVENPFEALKIQKQVRGLDYKQALRSGCLWQGLSATCCRNVVLVTLFFVLSDKLNHANELVDWVDFRQHPFLRGCAVTSCCWLAAWPLDVVKSQLQSEVAGFRMTPDSKGSGVGFCLCFVADHKDAHHLLVTWKRFERIVRRSKVCDQAPDLADSSYWPGDRGIATAVSPPGAFPSFQAR